MKNSLSKLGHENRVLTPELFKSNFGSIRERVKIYLSVKYRYAVNGNKVTGQNIDDYLSAGLERLMVNFDFENMLWENETISIYGFQKLWFYASQQVLFADKVKSTTTKKGIETNIIVGNIVGLTDGKECILNIVEDKLIEIDNLNTKNVIKSNVRKIVRNAIENADNDRDRLFFERVLAYIVIESAIRKASKVKKAIPVSDIIDCFNNQFQNIDAYFMFRKRMVSDVRLKKLKLAA